LLNLQFFSEKKQIDAKILHKPQLKLNETERSPPDEEQEKLLEVLIAATTTTILTTGYPFELHKVLRKIQHMSF